MLQAAINKAGVVDPMQIALALEGMEVTDAVGQKNTMRREDHQLIDQFYAAVFTTDVKYDSEHTGFGWKTVKTIPGIGPRATHDLQNETPGRSLTLRTGWVIDGAAAWPGPGAVTSFAGD